MAETETTRLQVSRRDRDVEMHVVFNAVQVNLGLTTVATVTACPLVMAALCNRGPLYFCPVVSFLLLSFFHLLLFFPRLISVTVDRMSAILLHMAWP